MNKTSFYKLLEKAVSGIVYRVMANAYPWGGENAYIGCSAQPMLEI